jgi:hypothetical protein
MVEISETHDTRGTTGRVRGLKTARCTIWPVEGAYQVQTVRLLPNGKSKFGSIRYSRFATYDAALTYALAYSNRIAKKETHA